MENSALDEILSIISDNNNCVEFEESLTVRMSPHSYPEKIRKVLIEKDNLIFENKEGELKNADSNSVIGSIYQRLRLLKLIKKSIK